jgi:phosphoglycerate dehydrogenase-like enzyme
MDVLVVERLDPDVAHWLAERHAVQAAPLVAADPRALRRALAPARAALLPHGVVIDTSLLRAAPRLRAIGRLSAGSEDIDLDACHRAGVEIVRPAGAGAAAEAEFALGALLQMLRRVPVLGADGSWAGRELSGATVGILGMAPAAQALARMLKAFGLHPLGYDPALHGSDGTYARFGVRPVSLPELFARCDAVAVLLTMFSRYRGLVGERFLAECRPGQVVVCLSPASVFDERALAEVLGTGRMAAAWLDCVEPGWTGPGQPLAEIETLQVTPMLAATTLESRTRAAWTVARRIDEVLAGSEPAGAFRTSGFGGFAGLGGLGNGPGPESTPAPVPGPRPEPAGATPGSTGRAPGGDEPFRQAEPPAT